MVLRSIARSPDSLCSPASARLVSDMDGCNLPKAGEEKALHSSVPPWVPAPCS
uniref:Uncharacterized protein n=1 Tax=Anguilla anguilla TaxID=7936 RepID=A0A0E9S067_ANGAN